MATAEIIVYFGFEPSARPWVDKLAKRLQTPENEEWLHILEDEILFALPEEDASDRSELFYRNEKDSELPQEVHAVVLFLSPAYFRNLENYAEIMEALRRWRDQPARPVMLAILTSFGGQEERFRKDLAGLEGWDQFLVTPRTPLDQLGEKANAVLDDIADGFGKQLRALAVNAGIPDLASAETQEEEQEEPPTLAEMILQAAGIGDKLAPDGTYLLERAYGLVGQQSQNAGQFTTECIFLAALEWGRRPPGAPSPPHALIRFAEAFDALNPEAIRHLQEAFLVSKEGGG